MSQLLTMLYQELTPSTHNARGSLQMTLQLSWQHPDLSINQVVQRGKPSWNKIGMDKAWWDPIPITYTKLFPKLLETRLIAPVYTSPLQPPFHKWYVAMLAAITILGIQATQQRIVPNSNIRYKNWLREGSWILKIWTCNTCNLLSRVEW